MYICEKVILLVYYLTAKTPRLHFCFPGAHRWRCRLQPAASRDDGDHVLRTKRKALRHRHALLHRQRGHDRTSRIPHVQRGLKMVVYFGGLKIILVV